MVELQTFVQVTCFLGNSHNVYSYKTDITESLFQRVTLRLCMCGKSFSLNILYISVQIEAGRKNDLRRRQLDCHS